MWPLSVAYKPEDTVLCPIWPLSVAYKPEDRMRRVLIAVDRSDNSRRAFNYALEHTAKSDDILHIYTAVSSKKVPPLPCVLRI